MKVCNECGGGPGYQQGFHLVLDLPNCGWLLLRELGGMGKLVVTEVIDKKKKKKCLNTPD